MGTSTGGGKLAGHLAVAGAYAIFGLNIVFCKDIANAALVSPIVLFTLRAIGASLLFWGLDLFRRPFAPREHVSGPDLLRIVAASALGLFIPQLTFLKAITISTSIDTAIMGTLSPIFTMFFAFFFVGEPITGKKAGGVALSFAAVLFLIFNSFHGESTGTAVTAPLGWALLLLNSLSFSLYLGLFRPLINRYSVVTFMKWMFLFSLLMSLPFSLKGMMVMDWSVIPGKVAWEIGYLIFFCHLRGLFPDSFRTAAHPAYAGEPVQLSATHYRYFREYLGGPGCADLAEGPGHRPHRCRCHAGEPFPRRPVLRRRLANPGDLSYLVAKSARL